MLSSDASFSCRSRADLHLLAPMTALTFSCGAQAPGLSRGESPPSFLCYPLVGSRFLGRSPDPPAPNRFVKAAQPHRAHPHSNTPRPPHPPSPPPPSPTLPPHT